MQLKHLLSLLVFIGERVTDGAEMLAVVGIDAGGNIISAAFIFVVET